MAWLSPGRLAAGKLTLLDGDPGLGKSTLLCEFAARLTRGEALPGGHSGPPRGVILLSAEDDLVDTIRPRIDAAGGDPSRVYAIPTLPQELGAGKLFAIPGHLTALEEIVPRLEVALVIVDPLLAFLDRRLNANNDQHVRRAGVALKDFAEHTGVAIVAVRHLNKSAGSNPLYRGGGSIGLIGAARCGLLLAADPDDPGRRILAASKANLAQPPASLAFRLLPVPGADVPRVVWEGESSLTAADLLRPTTNREQASALNAVRAWLRGRLAAGPRRGSRRASRSRSRWHQPGLIAPGARDGERSSSARRAAGMATGRGPCPSTMDKVRIPPFLHTLSKLNKLSTLPGMKADSR